MKQNYHAFALAATLLLAPVASFAQASKTTRTPVLAGIPARNGFAGHHMSFFAKATGSGLPGDTLTYSLEGAPEGMIINAQTGKVGWTPTATGPYRFSVRVTNKVGQSDSKSTLIIVHSDANAAATISLANPSATRQSDKAVTVTVNFVSAGTGPAKNVTLTAVQLNGLKPVALPGAIYMAGGSRHGIKLRFTANGTIIKANYTLAYSGTYQNKDKTLPFSGSLPVSVP